MAFSEGLKEEFKKPLPQPYDEIVSYLRSRNWKGTLTRVKESGLIKTIEEIEI